MKNIYIIAAILTLAACSMDQKPAPYEVYGTRYYGKSTSTYAKNHPVYHDEDSVDSSSPNYNDEIDRHNSTATATHPIGPTHLQTSASNGISSHPLEATAIDGNEQVVKLHNGAATNNTNDFQKNREPREESVPPVESTDNYVNPAEKNQDRNADEKLSRLRPIAKPAYTPSKSEVAANKTKIVPKVTTEAKSTIGTVAKARDQSADDVEETYDADNQPDADAAPIKPAPVEAERVVDNAAAKTKRETTIAAQKAVKPAPVEEPDETVQPVEKAELEKPAEVAPPAQTETAPAKKSQFIKPVDGTIVADFGSDNAAGGFNDGINIQAPDGTPVKSSAGGTVVYSGNQLQGYGNMVIVKHNNGFLTAYSHLKGLEVKKGDSVNQGDIIGHVGKTGNVNNPQLHFGIRKGREPVDPKDYL